MKDRRNFLPIIFATIVILLSNNSCQYDYSSPLPGTIDVRLHSISHNLKFQPNNFFVLKVSSVQAVRSSDDARVNVYQDAKAISRTLNVFNTLDSLAMDSMMVMGQTYIPPGDYKGIDLSIRPGSAAILDGYRNINVVLPAGFDPTLHFLKHFQVKEMWSTKLVLTIDLDSSLVKGANQYYFKPLYYISSIGYFPPQ